jgi:hypothetical protein
LQAILADGQLMPRVAKRAQALLALERAERMEDIVHWLGWSRMGLWYVWQRYEPYGVAAIVDAKRSGRPPVFSPPLARVQIERIACTDPSADGLHLARWDCRSWQQVVGERAGVDSIHDTTVARILATASLQPHRSRYWKTATLDERCVTQAAKILWRDERVAWLHERGEVVLCVDAKPHMHVLVRRVPTPPMGRGQMARRAFEYTRDGTVTFLAALHVEDGTMWGTCVEANDHRQVLRALGQLARRSPGATRVHLILDHGSSHTASATQRYLASHPRWRVFYTPPHASWLKPAALLLRAFADKYLKRFDPHSRADLSTHLEASGPEYNRRFAPPFQWAWSRRDL